MILAIEIPRTPTPNTERIHLKHTGFPIENVNRVLILVKLSRFGLICFRSNEISDADETCRLVVTTSSGE